MLDDNQKIIDAITKQLQEKPLPGNAPRTKLAPFHSGIDQSPNSKTRNSAVLILLWERNEQIQVVFTLRSTTLMHHSGQISFPGGRTENNETSIQTALRETYEEIGVPAHQIDIIGQLTPIFVLPSNSFIYPVVGVAKQYLDFTINKAEVAEVFSKPLAFFRFSNIKTREWEINGEKIDIPYWQIHPATPLWGATAMILAELVEVYWKINRV